MPMKNFSLRPFHKTERAVSVRGALRRNGGMISLWFQLHDPKKEVEIKDLGDLRQDFLWEHTCFELFIAPVGGGRYWELNINPYGGWNIYSFTDYRKGMHPEKAVEKLPMVVDYCRDSMVLHCVLYMGDLLEDENALEVGASAVLAYGDGHKEYWALAHTSDTPDFHKRSAFVLSL